MSKKFLFLGLAAILVLIGASCGEKEETPAPGNENQSVSQNVNQPSGANENTNSVSEKPSAADEENSSAKEVVFVDYVNKSLGYKIVRPDKWYWQHLIQKEIGEKMSEVDDLFITDPNPLPPLGTEYLGRIVVEVSGRSLADLERNFSDLTFSTATVGGISAKKYEGVRSNEMVENQKVINYLFLKDGKTYRIVYTKINSTTEEEAVFLRVVESLSF